MKSRWQSIRADESGALAVPFAIGIAALLSLAALSIDLGHLYTVKTEMRKAAEAGADAGARALRLGADPAVLDWNNGRNVAAGTVQQNYADNRSLADFSVANVQAGYWDTRWTQSMAPANLNGAPNPATTGYTPASPAEVPAVKVTLAKTQGGSGSSAPVTTYLASIMGINAMAVQATATAMLPTINSLPPGGAFPLATPDSFATKYYNSNPPYTFRIGPSYLNPDGGDWTSFNVDVNNVPYIRKLIDNGNPTQLSIGDNIWIEPGVKDSLYGYAAERIGQTVMLPIVPNNFETGAWNPVQNFIAFEITNTFQGSNPYIEGHFVRDYVNPNGNGVGGPYRGTTQPPKLVQ